MKMLGKKRNQKGFTLIEIIAVLVILGILAAVAVPRYLSLQDDAKKMAAVGQVAEIKGTLSSAWGKAFLATGATPDLAAVLAQSNLTAAGGTIGTSPDIWGYNLVAIGTTGYTINILNRDGDNVYAASGTWSLPN